METNSSQTWFTSKKGCLPCCLRSFEEMKWKKHKRTKVFARALKRELIHSDIFAMDGCLRGSSSDEKIFTIKAFHVTADYCFTDEYLEYFEFWKTHKAIYTEFVTSKNAKRNREADWNFWGWWRSLKNDVSWLGISVLDLRGKILTHMQSMSAGLAFIESFFTCGNKPGAVFLLNFINFMFPKIFYRERLNSQRWLGEKLIVGLEVQVCTKIGKSCGCNFMMDIKNVCT